MHGPPARDDGVAFSAALTDGEGVEGRSGVDDEEGDEKSMSTSLVLAGVDDEEGDEKSMSTSLVLAGVDGTDIEKAQPSALEASSGLAARSRPISSNIKSRYGVGGRRSVLLIYEEKDRAGKGVKARKKQARCPNNATKK